MHRPGNRFNDILSDQLHRHTLSDNDASDTETAYRKISPMAKIQKHHAKRGTPWTTKPPRGGISTSDKNVFSRRIRIKGGETTTRFTKLRGPSEHNQTTDHCETPQSAYNDAHRRLTIQREANTRENHWNAHDSRDQCIGSQRSFVPLQCISHRDAQQDGTNDSSRSYSVTA